MELLRNRNSVYQIGYHIVWCTKYRKPILTAQVADDVKELLLHIAKEGEFAIEQMEVMPDHVHLFITATPNHLIADMIKALKGVSARFLFKKHPELKKQLWGGHLWNPSYYVGTVGHISEETVRKYIESQKAGD
ncbi:MAG TPA: IS200/IS605 family transposase [Pelotomaculum sp.]|nr:IS200/IS605 family transposase [Pelotomaculum sp.]